MTYPTHLQLQHADTDPGQAYELGKLDGKLAERERCAKIVRAAGILQGQ